MSVARARANAVADGYAPYRWAAAVDEVAERHGVPREAVLKFDQNTPPLPGVPQVALGTSMARLNEYPDGTYRALREAAGGYVGLDAEHVVVGAGADDLILLLAHTFLAAGRRASVDPPTYALYRIATTLTGAEVVGPDDEAEFALIVEPVETRSTIASARPSRGAASTEPETGTSEHSTPTSARSRFVETG